MQQGDIIKVKDSPSKIGRLRIVDVSTEDYIVKLDGKDGSGNTFFIGKEYADQYYEVVGHARPVE